MDLLEELPSRPAGEGTFGELRQPGGLRAIVAALERSGARAVAALDRHPELAACEPLGTFGLGRTSALILRRLLLALRAPVLPLSLADRIPGDRIPAKVWDVLRMHCYWTGVRRGSADRDRWRRLTRGTVILMYHAIGEPGEPPSRYLVGVRRFRRQIRWIRLTRRPVLDLQEYLAYRQRASCPLRLRWSSPSTTGMPTTRRWRPRSSAVPGSRRPSSSCPGASVHENDWDPPGSALFGRPTMSWDELAALAADDGMSIGAHTVTHPRLGPMEPDDAEREMGESRTQLESRLGVAVPNLAYPFGDNTGRTQEIARDLGFASACGTDPGVNSPATPLYALPRLAPWGTRSLPRFALDLWLGRRVGESRGGEDGQG